MKKPPQRPGTWASNPVTDKELAAFYEKAQALADETFGVDDEGDSTVVVNLNDRSRFERNSFDDLPYLHRGDGALDDRTLEIYERRSIGNLNMAVRSVTMLQNLRDYWRAEKKEAEKKP